MKLTAAGVKAESRPGRYGDGGGLYLLVRTTGGKSWVFRYRLGDRQHDMGLGSWPEVTLASARQRAAEERARLRSGADPITARKVERAALARSVDEAADRTFEVVAERYVALHETGWRNQKHAAQWRATLATYAFPTIGKLDVAHIDRAAILQVLEPIWTRVPETASRVRGRIESILDFAATKQLRPQENPARWRDLRHELPQPRKLKPVENQPALPWRLVGEFVEELRKRPATAARALEFVILTAARTSEALGATWREVDIANAIWTVPARRMKAARPHRVPLSKSAIRLLETMRPAGAKPNDFLFPSNSKPTRSPLSTLAMLMLLRRMQRSSAAQDPAPEQSPPWCDAEGRAITVHGFRSTFRDWAGDMSGFPREVIEAALAHVLKDKAEAAYARSDLLERRRPLMEAWAGFIDGSGADREAVQLNTRRPA